MGWKMFKKSGGFFFGKYSLIKVKKKQYKNVMIKSMLSNWRKLAADKTAGSREDKLFTKLKNCFFSEKVRIQIQTTL